MPPTCLGEMTNHGRAHAVEEALKRKAIMLRTVVLYGNSLVLSSIGATLPGRPHLQVLVLDASQPGAAERLKALAADVLVFDPAAVSDKATFQKPHQYSEGFSYVFVNGEPVIVEGKSTGARPGKILYGPARN